MGYPTRVQLIKRKASEQWYINFPAALAQACDFSKGETVEWVVRDKYSLVLERTEARSSPAEDKVKKTP
jgi:antitoxin component of MazEF toxin-antitoxin module